MEKENVVRFYTPTTKEISAPLYISWAGRGILDFDKYTGYRILQLSLLVCVISGEGYLNIGGGDDVLMSRGSLFIIPANTRYCVKSNSEEPWVCYMVCFGGNCSDDILQKIGMNKEHFFLHFPTDKKFQAILELLSCLEDQTADSFAVLGSLELVFSEIKHLNQIELPASTPRKDIVSATVNFIKHYYYLRLDVDLLCDYVQYSRSYLSRLFNNEMNVTIPEYINQVRVAHAKELFQQTQLSVQEVSASVGISDSFYFSKTFKKVVGLSPNQYKKQFRAQQKR